jgi:hypothetical protein
MFNANTTVSHTAYVGIRMRQHAGEADRLGENPHRERGDELKNDGGGHVLDAGQQPQRDPAERRTGDDTADHREEKCGRDGGGGEAAGRDGTDGEPVNEQRARVIQQALAFEDRKDAVRRTQVSKDGGCGDGIRRCDDRTEDDRRRPWHFRDEGPRHNRDGNCCQPNRDNHQACHRRPVVSEIAERGVKSGIEQHGGDEEGEREFGRQRERERRADWQEGEQRTAKRQKDGISGSRASRRCRQKYRSDEENKYLLELFHLIRFFTDPASIDRWAKAADSVRTPGKTLHDETPCDRAPVARRPRPGPASCLSTSDQRRPAQAGHDESAA